jgi:hypothetical protein
LRDALRLPTAARLRRTSWLVTLAVLFGTVLVVVPAPRVDAARAMTVFHGRIGVSRSTAVPSFRMVGVSWPAGTSDASARVRVHDDNRWGPWQALDAESEDGPDRGSPEYGRRVATTPLWVGSADGYQVDARPAATARVELVREGARLVARASRGASAAANVAMPSMQMRDSWQAREPSVEPSYGEVSMAFVHHTVSSNDYAAADVPAMLRAIQSFHMDANGWNDMGYNFLVDRFGTIWEGRAGGVEAAVSAAQTEGFNSVSTGVAVIGTFSNAPPSQASLDAVVRLLAWKLPHHGVDPAGTATVISKGNARYPEGSSATFANVSGHRDGKSTDCPGQALYDRLPWIRVGAEDGAAAVVAFAPVWRGGVFVDAAQLDVGGTPGIVVGADAGGGPEVRTFNADGSLRTARVVFPEGFRGGVRVAAGNVDGAPGDELVVAAGAGGGPQVRVLQENGLGLSAFQAYPAQFTGGVYVTTGNVDGVPGEEIITGAGAGGGPQVRVFRFDGTPIGGFFAFDPRFPGGVRVTAADVDGDGIDEIVAGAGPGGGPQVRVFRLDGSPVFQFMAYGEAFRGGVYVSRVRSDDQSRDWVATGAGDGGGPQVRIFDAYGHVRFQFFSGRPTATTGVRVASGSFGDGTASLVLAPGRGGPPLVKISRLDGHLVFPGTATS